jgi:hypothetical protein
MTNYPTSVRVTSTQWTDWQWKVVRHRRPSRVPQALRAALALVLMASSLVLARNAYADEATASADTLRTGWDPAEPALTPAAVTGSNFGQLFATKVTGQVYAQPLLVGGTLVVSTEDDWVYGLDPATGAIRWSDNLGPTWPSSTIGCADLAPNIGNTSTGTYDPATGTVYLTTKVNNGPDALSPNWYLHAISASTGVEKAGWPVKITGTPSNDPVHPFVGKDVNQRAGLLLLNGVVYMAFGSQCDYGTYVGWVAGVNTSTQATNIWSDEAGPSSSRAGIWQAGGGLVSDGPGRIFLSTGNGITAPDGPGTSPPQQLSQSVVRLGVAANGTLSAQDFFSPSNASTLDTNDQDLGSGGPVALPSQYFGSAGVPNLMVEIGKDGRLFLLNRDNLGGKGQAATGGDAVVQVLGPYHGVWGHPAVYGGEGGYVYVVPNGGQLLAFKYGTDGQGLPALSLAGNSSESFAYTAGSPAVTSNGVTPGSAVVWVVNVDGPTGANGRLCAYGAVPTAAHLPLLRCFPIGTAVKFGTPATDNGRVYVGTRDGYVYGFGQPAAAALNAAQTSFGNVNVGATGHATVVATAQRPVTVTALSAPAPFAVTQPALPVTLAQGQSMSVDVAFSPTAPGSFTGGLTFSLTDAGAPAAYGAALQGTAIQPGFTPSPSTLDFGDVALGATKSLTASFTNTGVAAETVSAFTGPAAPFTSTGAPANGTVLAPGQSVSLSLAFTPTTAGVATTSVSITGQHGTATVAVKGNGVTGAADLQISPTSVDFGRVPIGSSASQQVTVTNAGNLAVTITKAAPPGLPFVVDTPLPEGLVLGPDDTVTVTVTFAPTTAGTATSQYTISSDDGHGAHNVGVTGVGVNPAGAPLPAVVGGGWVLNGSASVSGPKLTLTAATANQTGSAVFSAPLSGSSLTATFTVQCSGGTGGEGLTFALLTASGTTPKSIGTGGAGLGLLGLPGVAVTFDTAKSGNDPSANFIGLSAGSSNGVLTYLATATGIPSLRTGTHTVKVTVSAGTVTVLVDGVQRLSARAPVAASVYPAFTGSTGTLTDAHVASNIVISSGGTALPSPGNGWRYNGAATTSSGEVILTPATRQAAGAVIYPVAIPTNGMAANFTLTTNGGTGADGTTFALLDPAQQSPVSLGGLGAGLGVAGLAGVAVALCTYPQNGVNSHNFVAILTSTKGSTATTLVAANTNIPDLRAASRAIRILVSGKTISVWIDGTAVLSATVAALTPTALAAFTASTGGFTDIHRIASPQVLAGPSTLPGPPSNWVTNGSATMNGGTLQLTPAATNLVGSAFCKTAIPTARLDVSFTLAIGGGNGADGLTFALQDALSGSPTAVGAGGGGLGFSGLAGVAVSFVTYHHPSEPSSNFIGISTGGSGRALSYVASTTDIPDLRSGTHQAEIIVDQSGALVVKLDGVTVLTTAVPVPKTALVGFTAATGARYDAHTVSGINILY